MKTSGGGSLRPISAVFASCVVLVNLLAGGVAKAQYQYVEYKPQSTRDAGTFVREGQERSSMFGPALPPQPGQPAEIDEMYQDAVRLAISNPTEAIASAEQLPDDTRTIALLQVARMVSRYDPVRAATVIAEVQQDSKSATDEETLVDIISAQAFVAAGQNDQSALHDSLRQGFASANHMLLEQQGTRRNYVSIPALTPLVHIGMESDPDFTIPFVEGLPASRVKAEVLLDAAHALGTRGSPHIGGPTQQSAEKPNP